MPYRLARSSVPLNYLIATQKRKKKLPHCCHSATCCNVHKHGAHQMSIFTYPLSTPSSSHPPHFLNAPPCTAPPPYLPSLPFSLPIVHFADKIKQTNVHWCVRSSALDCAAKRKNPPALSGRSNSICKFGLSHSVFINICHSYQETTGIHY